MTSSREVRLTWTGRDVAFRGGEPDGPSITLDGDGEEGPSPTTALLLSLAACMAADVRQILEKGRVTVTGLDVVVVGIRVAEDPRRFEAIRMVFDVAGPAEADRKRMERALALSRSTYCSVLHTLRPDLELDLTIRRS